MRLIDSAADLPVRLAPIAQTKADTIHLLEAVQPAVAHSTPARASLDARLKEHKIGRLRTKHDPIRLPVREQSSLKKARQISDQLEQIPPSDGLHDLAVVERQEMTKAKGLSLNMNMTEKDVLELLDDLEPGVDNKALH